MRVCPVCQTRFKDTTVTCRYCDVRLEQMSPPSADKKAGRRYGSKGKKAPSIPAWQRTLQDLSKKYWYWAYFVFLLIILSYVGFNLLSEKKNFAVINKDIQQPSTEIERPTLEMSSTLQPFSDSSLATTVPSSSYAYDWFNKAFMLCRSGKCTDIQKVIEYLDKAINLKPDYAEAFNNRGIAFYELGQHSRAIDDYNESIRIKPQRAESFNNRGTAYAGLGEHKRSIEDYNQAIQLKPKYPEAYNNRGTAYMSLKQYQQAVDDYTEAIRLKPDHVDLYQNRGMAYLAMKNKTAGCPDLNKACELGKCESLEKAKSQGLCP